MPLNLLAWEGVGAAMRVRFSEVFTQRPDGCVTPKVPVVLGGVRIEPGTDFGCRVRIGGVHFAAVRGRDLEIERSGGVVHVLRHYASPARGPRPLPRAHHRHEVGVPVEA